MCKREYASLIDPSYMVLGPELHPEEVGGRRMSGLVEGMPYASGLFLVRGCRASVSGGCAGLTGL